MATDVGADDLVDPPDHRPYPFEWAGTESVTVAILEAVEAATGEGVSEMEPLLPAINPDGLEALFDRQFGGPPPEELLVEFPYNGVRVQLHGNGTGLVFRRS